MAILVLFEQFRRQILFNFLPLTLKSFTKYDTFFAHFSQMRTCVMRKDRSYVVIKEVRNYGKIILIKNVAEYG